MAATLNDALPLILGLATVLAAFLWQQRHSRLRRRALQLQIAAGSMRSTADVREVASYAQALAARGDLDVIDERTWADLDLDPVFTRIDRTASTAGRQLLYAKLRRRGAPGADRTSFADRVYLLVGAPQLREELQLVLADLSDPSGYDIPRLIFRDLDELPAYTKLAPLLAALPVVLLIAAVAVDTQLLLAAAAAAGLNCVIDLMQRKRIGEETPPLRVLPALLSVGRRLAGRVQGPLAAACPNLSADAAALAPLRRAAFWLLLDRDTSNELTRIVQEYLNMFLLLDVNAYNSAASTIRRRREELRRLFSAVGEIDAACAVAVLRTDARTCEPLFGQRTWALEIEDGAHPLVDDCVPNHLTVQTGGVLVTGSNMSGKSTFLRTVGVNAVLAQNVGVAFASRYRGPWLEIRTSIGRSDDLQSGTSYYLAEVKRIGELVAAAGSPLRQLFILDELFRGTNTVERIAASCAVLEHLARAGDFVLVATHDIELVDLLHAHYEPVHFRELVVDGRLEFDYKLQPGRSSTRNAIAILELMRFPSDIVARALAIAESTA